MTPKILYFDIETSPLITYTWGLWDQNIGLNQVHTDWYILSWAAKWSDEKIVKYKDLRYVKEKSDLSLMKPIWDLLDEADIVITQNGKDFDTKKLNARFLYHGFTPPSPYRHIDTLKIAKKYFGFTSNKLAYMTEKFCTKYKKLEHKKYPGFELWKECLAGNLDAWKEMEVYNKHDVLGLEELYTYLQAWDSSISFNTYSDSEVSVCNCGSKDVMRRGYSLTNLAKYQRYKCLKCGAWFRDNTNLLSRSKRDSLKRGL